MTCRKCKAEEATFYKGKSICKQCCNQMVKEAKMKKPFLYRKLGRSSKLKRLYGISLDEYSAMLVKQDYSCAICSSKDSGRRDVLNFAVDHCHDTNKIRGLLCMKCNTAIGKMRHDVEYLRKAIEYLSC